MILCLFLKTVSKSLQMDLTRVYDPDGSKICVKAVAVWDTVGALGSMSCFLTFLQK
jgi:hypothetical protein